MSVTEADTNLLCPGQGEQGLWGQEQRVSHCPAWWQGHRGKVELGEVDWNGDLARFCQ